MLLTDHNVRETLRVCGRAYIIKEGKVLRSGTPRQIEADELVRQTTLGESFQL